VTGKRRTLVLFVTIGGATLAIVCWLRQNPSPSLQLPHEACLPLVLRSGLAESPKGWYTNQVLPRPPLVTLENVSLRKIRWALGFKLAEMLGRHGVLLPEAPTGLLLKCQLDTCSESSGKTYLLAKELIPTNVVSNWDPIFRLGFEYDGTNRALNARHRITLVETAILKSGLIESRVREHPIPTADGFGLIISEPYCTNPCAIIRDTRNFVKIVPLNCLAAYSVAGLIHLPKEYNKPEPP
jgi:hypothetical protein